MKHNVMDAIRGVFSMVISFNLGGRVNFGTTYFGVDNISVAENTPVRKSILLLNKDFDIPL